ncbi:TIR-like protein FxsC [Streptomyces sp. NPDC056464]|uniref:TIR-like protein FxsC n=1 Tax=Streptomyces sp. NPDC056464 TaxID=3345828 RepID=UPI00367A6D14
MTESRLARHPTDSQDLYFFHSYAQLPGLAPGLRAPGERQEEFHNLLGQFVLQLTTHEGTTPIGFLDKRMPLGGAWEKHLKEALATCRVFLPVYSPRYFASHWCGIEFDGFMRRQAEHHRSERYTVSAIVPVLWTSPGRILLPEVVQPFQYHSLDLGDDYRNMGLLGLREAGKWRDYRRTVWRIAERIVDVAAASRLKSCDVKLFDDLRNVFAPGTQGGS